MRASSRNDNVPPGNQGGTLSVAVKLEKHAEQ